MTTLLNKTRFFLATLLFLFVATGCDSNSSNDPVQQDIVAVASEAGFNTLVAAVQAADLVETLKGPGPFTVFAPTEAAFNALPEGTLENLLLPENKNLLTSILTYHVVAGKVTSEEVVGLTSATTVQGENLTITVEDGTVLINGVAVTQTDVEASNGIIHIIDGVLLPPSVQ